MRSGSLHRAITVSAATCLHRLRAGGHEKQFCAKSYLSEQRRRELIQSLILKHTENSMATQQGSQMLQDLLTSQRKGSA